MQNNQNHSHRAHVCRSESETCLRSFWLPVPVSVCVLFVCVCGPQLCFFAARLHFLPTRVCVSPEERSGGWWLNRPDAFAGSVVKHQRAQRKGEEVVRGWVVTGRSSLLTILECFAWTEHPTTTLLLHHYHPFPLIPFPDITILALSRNFAHTLPWNSS